MLIPLVTTSRVLRLATVVWIVRGILRVCVNFLKNSLAPHRLPVHIPFGWGLQSFLTLIRTAGQLGPQNELSLTIFIGA